jgi:hypothetical protein
MMGFTEWESFFVIVGSAAGALIGLQFVVMTLIQSRAKQPGPETGAAFATPTIVHFSSAFLLSAIVRMPFRTATPLAVLLGTLGLIGVGYALKVTWRVRRQNIYRPVFEDWLFHCVLPFGAYVTLTLSVATLLVRSHLAMFGVAATVLLLLFIGIHNSWDAVSYHVFHKPSAEQESTEGDEASEEAE